MGSQQGGGFMMQKGFVISRPVQPSMSQMLSQSQPSGGFLLLLLLDGCVEGVNPRAYSLLLSPARPPRRQHIG